MMYMPSNSQNNFFVIMHIQKRLSEQNRAIALDNILIVPTYPNVTEFKISSSETIANEDIDLCYYHYLTERDLKPYYGLNKKYNIFIA